MSFQDKICDDLCHKLYQLRHTVVTDNEIHDSGLHLIDNILHDSGHALSDFPSMMQSCLNWSETLPNCLISQQINFDDQYEAIAAHHLWSSLNLEQKNAFQQIWQSIIHHEGKVFFINGFGGCGKTYLYQALCHALWAEKIIILCVASTGLAGLSLPRGQTAHLMFKIPIDGLDSTSVCKITKESLQADLLRMMQAMIYDECLMTHWHSFKALNRTFQDLCDCHKPFGGLTMILEMTFNRYYLLYPMDLACILSTAVFESLCYGMICKFWNYALTCDSNAL